METLKLISMIEKYDYPEKSTRKTLEALADQLLLIRRYSETQKTKTVLRAEVLDRAIRAIDALQSRDELSLANESLPIIRARSLVRNFINELKITCDNYP